MSSEEVQTAMRRIESETDPNVRALLLAAVVSEAFRAEGFEPVVVGGAAIEFYTDGAYMSGDVGICWTGSRIPTPADQTPSLPVPDPANDATRKKQIPFRKKTSKGRSPRRKTDPEWFGGPGVMAARAVTPRISSP